MCRSAVARVIGLDGTDAIVEFEGVRRRASALLTPELAPGDLVLIGLGTVLGRVSPADLEALRALESSVPTSATPPPADHRQGATG